MSALAQCDAFGFIYDQAGDPAPDILVVLKRVLDAGGNPILLGPKTTLTDSAGSFHFTLPELATAFISARASALWNCPDGRAFTVPPGPSGELVPDFSLPSSTLVEPPLVYVDDVLSIPRASETQDGYLSAADFVAFQAGAADVGISQINTGAGLTGGPITDTGTIAMQPIAGVAGTWANPSSISINAYGQIIAITATADTTAPAISGISATPTSSGATIIWTTDDFSDSQVEYSTDLSYTSSTTLNTTPVQSHSVLISGTAPLTPYHYRVKSRNTAGLLTTSGDNTFTTTAVVDTTAPNITSVASSSITGSGAAITWTTDDLADSKVEYSADPDSSYGSATTTTDTSPMVTSHSVPLTGLTALTLYHYRVKSTNAIPLSTTSPGSTFTTGPAATDPSVGIVSYWKMDEASGTRADSLSLNPLSINGPDLSSAGKIGNATSGNGSGAWLQGTDSPSFGISGPMTIAGWLKPHVAINDMALLLQKWSAAGTRQFFLVYNGYTSPGTPGFQFGVSPDGTAASSVSVPMTATADTWYFLVGWYDGSMIHLQVNDGTPASLAFTGPVFHGSSTPLSLLYSDGSTNVFTNGAVDEVGIWSRVLTAAERTLLYAGGAGVTYPF